MEILKQSGLEDRINNLDSYDVSNYMIFSEKDYHNIIELLENDGYFENLPRSVLADYNEKISEFIETKLDPEKQSPRWTLLSDEKEDPNDLFYDKISEIIRTENADSDDFDILSGFVSSEVLEPEDFARFQEYGFENIFDMFGVVGTYLYESQKMHFREGQYWISDVGKSTFRTVIFGSHDGDFRLERRDITPYKTLDPMGNIVNYRPCLDSDTSLIAGSHSVEPFFLVSLLKYADQVNIDSELLKKYSIKSYINEISKKGMFAGPFADFGDGLSIEWHFINYDVPIPLIDENDFCDERTVDGFNLYASQDFYGLYVDEDENLVFAYEKEHIPEKNIVARIPKTEFDDMLKSLLVQTQQGLGRTSLKQMYDVVDFMFSNRFKKSVNELRKS
ncbi:MAG: hypothetical protein ACLFPQ_03375 [Candidatus Woesearchaeota archaeon]